MTPETLPEPARRLPFDRAAAQVLSRAVGDVLALCPEVRAVAVALDYHGDLNDAQQLVKRLWLGRRHEIDAAEPPDGDPRVGPVRTADAIVGGLFCTLPLVRDQLAAAGALAVQLREQLEVLVAEQVRCHEEVQKLRGEIARRAGGPAADA